MKRPKQSTQPVAVAISPARKAYWLHGCIILGLLAVSWALYCRTLDLGFFNEDDKEYVQSNPFISPLSAANLARILSEPYFANYAPGHLLSYALDVALAGGRSPWALHLSNIVWYGWTVCMVYVLAFTIRADILMAAAAAFLFAAHPAHVEVVAWISSRKDLVGTSFALLAMVCYIRYRGNTSKATEPRAKPLKGLNGSYLASLGSFVVASSAKQSVILLPAIMLVWDVLIERRRAWHMVADKVPFGLVTVFFGAMGWHAQPSYGQMPNAFVLAATEWTNLWLLSGFGDYVMYRPRPDPGAISAAARLAVIAAAALSWVAPLLLAHRRQPLFGALLYWMLINMLPPMALSFLTPITDRYLFLPSVGICILLAAAARSLANRWQTAGAAAWVALIVIGGFWACKALDYLSQWRDPRSVWFFAAAKVKTTEACQYAGDLYREVGDRMQEFLKSGQLPSVSNELALAQAVLDDPQRLGRLRAEWTGLDPGRTNSAVYRDQLWRLAWDQYEKPADRRGKLDTPPLLMRRGTILVNQGRPEEGIKQFQTGLRLADTIAYPPLRQEIVTHLERALGIAYWSLHRYPEAREWLLKAQAAQRLSHKVWIPSLDDEVERIKHL